MWVGSPFDDEALAWDDAVEKARTVVAALREASRASEGGSDHLVALLGEIRTSVLKDEEFVAALGCAAGHGLITRLVGHPDDDVAAAAGDAMCACVAQCPPGSAFPSRGEVDAPHFSLVDVGTLRRPLALRLRHVREPESMGGEGKKSIPNIVWPSGVVLARWLARHPELVKDAEVLEMGAGLGAPGMTAAAFGARRVVLTDADPAAVRNMAYNARQGAAPLRLHAGHQSTSHGGGASAVAVDAIATRCTAAVLDWHAKDDLLPALGANTEAPACDVDGTRAFDVILGADVVHEEGMVGAAPSPVTWSQRARFFQSEPSFHPSSFLSLQTTREPSRDPCVRGVATIPRGGRRGAMPGGVLISGQHRRRFRGGPTAGGRGTHMQPGTSASSRRRGSARPPIRRGPRPRQGGGDEPDTALRDGGRD